MRSICVVQAADFCPYLPIFLAHHERIFDGIYVCIHNNGRILPNDTINIRWFYLDEYSYCHHLTQNYLYKIRDEIFEFVLPLDIDEFIFCSEPSFEATKTRISEYQKHAHVRIHWYPVVPPIHFSGSIRAEDLAGFRLSGKPISVHKIGYYSLNYDHFFIMRGNHYANGKARLFSKRGVTTDLGIAHIPFLGMNQLRKKMKHDQRNRFYEKITECAPWLIERYGSDWYLSSLSHEDFCRLAVNYRIRDPRRHLDLQSMEFKRLSFLEGLEARTKHWSAELARCGTRDRRTEPRAGEKQWLDDVLGREMRDSSEVLELMELSSDRTIRFGF